MATALQTQPDALTHDELRGALPGKMKKSVTPQLLASINQVLAADPDTYETYRENLLSYTHVMQDGKFKIEQYLNAVRYVSYKMMGKTNFDAFSLTFPDKIQRWTAAGTDKKDMSSYVSAYNKSKLVGLLLEQTVIPVWVLNQDNYQKAINTQVELMASANSEKVRSDAANSLLTHLKQPENAKIQLDVNVKEGSVIDELRKAVTELTTAQREALRAGAKNAGDIAKAPVIYDVTPEAVP